MFTIFYIKIKLNMKILIATFDHNYYLWQCLVQINNFMKQVVIKNKKVLL